MNHEQTCPRRFRTHSWGRVLVTVLALFLFCHMPTWAQATEGSNTQVYLPVVELNASVAETQAVDGQAADTQEADTQEADTQEVDTQEIVEAAKRNDPPAPQPNTVSTQPMAAITINNVYRVAKQRLLVTVTVSNPAITSVMLQPYQTEAGTIFDPATLGGNLTVTKVTLGAFTITAVGAPPPACNLSGDYATPCTQKPLSVQAFADSVLVTTSDAAALDTSRQN